jgi:hypothetical protein
MAFANEPSLVRAGAHQATANFIETMRQSALDALRKDLADTALKESPDPDAYVARANAVALGVFDGGAVEIAERIYQELISVVDQHMDETKERRHKGALLANQGTMNMAMQRYDVGIPLIQYVVLVEDPKTYGVAPEDSFGNVVRRNQLDDPALNLLLKVLSDAHFPLGGPASRHELENAFGFLGESVHVLYGVILGLAHNIRFALRTVVRVNYMTLRMFDAFRAYAFFLEELVGRLAVVEASRRMLPEPSDPSGIPLRKGLQYVFGRQKEERSWWPRLSAALTANSQRCRDRPIADQNERLQELADSRPETVEDTLITSIAILDIVRNMGAHEIYPPPYLVAPEIHLENVLAWLTAAAILINRNYITPYQMENPV